MISLCANKRIKLFSNYIVSYYILLAVVTISKQVLTLRQSEHQLLKLTRISEQDLKRISELELPSFSYGEN